MGVVGMGMLCIGGWICGDGLNECCALGVGYMVFVGMSVLCDLDGLGDGWHACAV